MQPLLYYETLSDRRMGIALLRLNLTISEIVRSSLKSMGQLLYALINKAKKLKIIHCMSNGQADFLVIILELFRFL